MELTSDKSRAAGAALAFFLGCFGAHRFYVGKTGTAIVMLLLTLSIVGALFSGIWAFVDFILILAGSFKDKRDRNLTNW